MPQLGEIKRASDIGYGGGNKYIWSACNGCGKQRWVQLFQEKPESAFCLSCSQKLSSFPKGNNHKNWKGGRHSTERGYILVYLSEDDFFAPMARRDHCVLEHRLVMAKHLKRCLLSWEVVHHKNEIRYDNRIENLELVTALYKHAVITRMACHIKKLESTIKELKAQLREKK